MPVIKITGIGNVQKGRARLTEVVGERIDGSGEWKGAFYTSNTDLSGKIAQFGKGDTINVKMVKNSRGYWDVNDITEADSELVKTVQGKGAGEPVHYGKNNEPTRAKSNWNGRTGEAYDRSAAVYLAFDMIKTSSTDAALKKMSPEDLMTQVIGLSGMLYDYIHDGEAEEEGSDDDALNPPEVD